MDANVLRRAQVSELNAPSSATTARYGYMDSLRAALIIGGVFFHSALPYRTHGHWNVTDPSTLTFFDHVCRALSSFRMSTFFFVAGFFCALTFASRNANQNLRQRLRTFALPLLVLLATVQPLQYVMRLGQDEQVPTDAALALKFYFTSGAYMSHLWFLVNLIVYYLLVWLALRLTLRYGANARVQAGVAALGRWVRRLPAALRGSKTLLAVACALAVLPLTHGLNAALPDVPGLSLQDMVGYLPFFAVGFICFESTPALLALSEVSVSDVVALVAIDSLAGTVHPANHLVQRALSELVFYQNAWVIGMLLVWTFRRFLNAPSPMIRSVSDAAYSIYLFHHILVVALATLLLHVAMPGGHLAKYATVVALTCALTYALHHHVIAGRPLLRLLFNGRSARR